jgi:hypothetical protein
VTTKSDRPLDLAQWGDILQGLGIEVERIQGFPATHAREVQYAFYHGAMMEFRGFQHLYRDRTAHSREHYDLHRARSAMEHVTRFMKILADRISEGKEQQTPEIWTDNWLKEQDAKTIVFSGSALGRLGRP